MASAVVGTILVSAPGGAASATTDALNPQIALAEQLLAVANDESKPPAQRAIDTARLAVAARRDVVGDHLVPLLDQEARNLDIAERLLGMSVDESNALESGIEIAKIATAWQVATLGLDLSTVELPVTPNHNLPSEAAIAFIKGEGGELSPLQLEELRRFDNLPPDTRSALADYVDAFAAFAAATDLAYSHADHGRLEDLAASMEAGTLDPASLTVTGPGSVLADLGIDLAPVFLARNNLLEALVPLQEALTDRVGGGTQPMSAGPDFQFAPYLSIELDLGEANTYSQDFLLMLDAGGNDTYLNNAGGAALFRDAAALVDLFGNDQYRSGRGSGINGGGSLGSGFLVDTVGDDLYTAAGSGTNGGGNVGTGFLLDALGEDQYNATSQFGTNGGGAAGTGMLIDPLGADRFTATNGGTNGGGDLAGVGFLLGGTTEIFGLGDVYAAGSNGTNGGGFFAGAGFLFDGGLIGDSYSAGGSGVNGGGGGLSPDLLAAATTGGSGFLFDAGGADTYGAASKGVNGGGEAGAGLLIDAAGSDSFTGGSNGVNGGGGVGGVGFLVTGDGNDQYIGTSPGVNGGGVFGSGLLLDAGGSDVYSTPAPDATNGGGVFGVGALFDGGGEDAYTGLNGGAFAGTGTLFDGGGNDAYTGPNGEALLGAGLLLDAAGTDRYRPNGGTFVFDETVVPKGLVGAQIDLPPASPVPTTVPTVTTTSVPLPPTTLPTVTTSTLPTVTTSTVPQPPPVVTVDFEDPGRCSEVKLINDDTLFGVWHSDPATPPYSVCILVHFPISFQVRITVDPAAVP